MLTDLATTRATLARAILGDPPPATLGSITLEPHQRDGIARVEHALARWNGALLCDDTGLGKTFVALAIAARHQATLVATPANLRNMWLDAASRAAVEIRTISLESLGYPHPLLPPAPYTLVIVDEAHHARNPRTKRYANLARICTGRTTLLVTATPIHNRTGDLTALLALFLGPRATNIDDSDLAQLLIRRTHTRHPDTTFQKPHALATRWHTIMRHRWPLARILDLPPPTPPAGAGDAPTLTTLALLRQWASSDAALLGALQRRYARALALHAALEAGRLPTRQALRAWAGSDDAVQLAFAELLADPTPDPAALKECVATHAAAVSRLAATVRTHCHDDARRATLVRAIRAAHPDERIIAFATYADTVRAIYRHIRSDGYVAALTAHGGTLATGHTTRHDVLARFAPSAFSTKEPPRSGRITLLITTDLASEGLNLQDASVVIHLDAPWTAARLAQRTGRAARIGSTHRTVAVYGIRPPRALETTIRSLELIHRKNQLAARILGAGPAATPQQSLAPTSIACRETLDNCLQRWRDASPTERCAGMTTPAVTTAPAPRNGFLAACTIDGVTTLIGRHGTGAVTTDPKSLATIATAVDAAEHDPGNPAPVELARAQQSALRSIRAWADRQRARSDAGIHDRIHPRQRTHHNPTSNSGRTIASTNFSRRVQHAELLSPRQRSPTTTPPNHDHNRPVTGSDEPRIAVIALIILAPAPSSLPLPAPHDPPATHSQCPDRTVSFASCPPPPPPPPPPAVSLPARSRSSSTSMER